MIRSNATVPPLPLIGAILVITLGILVALVMSKLNTVQSLALGLGIVIFVLAFLKTEIALYFLIFSMLLSPEISFGSYHEAGVTGGRSVVIRLDDLFLVLIAIGWMAKSAIYKGVGLIQKSPLNAYIYIYIAVLLISTGTGVLYGDVQLALGFFNVLKMIEYFVVFFMVMNNIDSQERARRLAKAALVCCFIITIYAIVQIPTGERLSAPFEGKGGEPNTLGGYLVLMISISLALFLETGNLFKRIGYALFSILCLVCIFYTESRSSYIGLLFSTIVLAIFVKRRNLLLLGVVLTVIFSSILIPERVVNRIGETFQQSRQSNALDRETRFQKLDESTEARLASYQTGFNNWKKYPILGWGVTGHSFLDAQYVKVLAETGAVGAIAFLLLLFKIFRVCRKMIIYTRERDEFYHSLSIGVLAGFIGLCGHALGTNTFIIIRIMEPFWLFMGIIVCIPRILSPPVVQAEAGK